MSIKKILLTLPGGIGNAIMFTPAFQKIRAEYQEAEISLVTSNLGAEEVFKNCGLKEVYKYDRRVKTDFLKIFLKILFFRKYDIFISAMGVSSIKAGLLGLASKASARLGEEIFFGTIKIFKNYDLHEVERNLNIISSCINGAYKNFPLKLFYNYNDETETEKIISENGIDFKFKKYIGLHLGSNEFLAAKRWPIDNFSKLIELINLKYPQYIFIIFGGKNEAGYAAELKAGDKIINITGKTSLNAAGIILSKLQLFITNDSGLMHLAAAAGIRIAAIFGPTIPQKNRPYTKDAIIISKNYECQPCYKYNRKIKCRHDFKCIRDVTPEEVFLAIEKLFV